MAPAATDTLARAWHAAEARRPLLASTDRDDAQALVGRVFRPHRLEPRPGARLDACMEHLGAGLLGLSLLRYGAEVDILPGPLEHFYLLQLPLAGSARIETAGRAFRSDPGCASLLSPQPDLRMRWGADNVQLCVRIEAQTLQRFFCAWSGGRAQPLPVFEPQVMLDRQPRLLALLADLLQASAHGAPGLLSQAELQYRLLALLLTALPHDASHRLPAGDAPATPQGVRRVEAQLHARCDEPWTPLALAALAGVSVRSLYLGFQQHRGVGPMTLLRELRLRRVREALLQAEPGTRVTDLALRWGFSHLGRFAQDYRRAFGEPPSRTLRPVRPGPAAPARGPSRRS